MFGDLGNWQNKKKCMIQNQTGSYLLHQDLTWLRHGVLNELEISNISTNRRNHITYKVITALNRNKKNKWKELYQETADHVWLIHKEFISGDWVENEICYTTHQYTAQSLCVIPQHTVFYTPKQSFEKQAYLVISQRWRKVLSGIWPSGPSVWPVSSSCWTFCRATLTE